MQKPNKIVLFDIDHTLFNTEYYLENFFHIFAQHLGINDKDKFNKLVAEARIETRKKAGFFDPLTFIEFISKHAKKPVTLKGLEKIFFENKFFNESIYGDVHEALLGLSKYKNISMGIFSKGEDKHQKQKINVVAKYFHNDHIYISTDKLGIIKKTLNKYKNQQIFIIDDLPEVLEEAKKHHKNIFTVWIKRNKDAEIPKNFKPDITIANFNQLTDIIRSNN